MKIRGERLKIRKAKTGDISSILALEVKTWGQESAATKEMMESRMRVFPEGVMVAELGDRIIGVVAIEKIKCDEWIDKDFSWYDITDNGFIRSTHNEKGDAVYGVDLSVDPDLQRMGIGTKLSEHVGKFIIKNNLKCCLLGERVPEYHKYASGMSIEEYIKSDLDPEIKFYKKAGLKIVRPLKNYFKDSASLDYGVLVKWRNPCYNKWYRLLISLFFRV